MSERFFISDTHFGHDAVYGFKNKDGSRVRDVADNSHDGDAIMVQRWNSVVQPHDKVYHLGDSLKNNHKTFLDESLPEGSPILVVPPPSNTRALCPFFIRVLIALSWTRLPAWRASAVASKPI